jgi:hypothetical protein
MASKSRRRFHSDNAKAEPRQSQGITATARANIQNRGARCRKSTQQYPVNFIEA